MDKHFKRVQDGTIPFLIVVSLTALYFLILGIINYYTPKQISGILSTILTIFFAVGTPYLAALSAEKKSKN